MKISTKVISILLILAILIGIMPMNISRAATSGTCGENGGSNVTWELDDSGTLTISGNGAMEDYAYESSPFYDKNEIKKVIINNGVTSIGDFAFASCSGLTSITIPESVTTIGIYAFYYCTGLTNVTIPKSVTTIGIYAFSCSGLVSVTIPNSITTIGNGIFDSCSELKNITIPYGVTSIGSCAFLSCSGLTSITIPTSVISLEASAFGRCSSLTSITIPNSVETIGEGAFNKVAQTGTMYVSGGTSTEFEDKVKASGNLENWTFANIELGSIEIMTAPNKTEYYEGETFDPTGLVIRALNNNGSIRENVPYIPQLNAFSFDVSTLKATDNKVTITYREKTVDLPITVTKTIFSIGKNATTNGSFSVDKATSKANQTVTITLNPNEGYELDTLQVLDSKKNPVATSTNPSDGKVTFEMPSDDVTVNVTYKAINYNIIKEETTTNGTFTVDKTIANFGDIVTITPSAINGYEVNKFIVLDEKNTEVPTNTNDGITTFSMPSSSVTVNVTFKKSIYNVITDSTENGRVVVENETASIGDAVTITTLPNVGYEVDTVIVLDNEVKEIKVTIKDDKATFTMPSGAVKIDVKYKATKFEFTKGQNSEYKAEDADGIEFRITGALSIFKKAYINGVELDKTNYTLASGSTVLTLTDEYLKTLAVGEYTLKAEYTNGTDVETKFTIASVPEKTEETVKDETQDTTTDTTPKTGDNIVFFVGALLIAMLGTAVVVIKKNKMSKTSKH